MGKPKTERQKKQNMVKGTYAFYLGGIIALLIINPNSFLIPILLLMMLGHLFLDPRIAFWKWGKIFGKEDYQPSYQSTTNQGSYVDYQNNR